MLATDLQRSFWEPCSKPDHFSGSLGSFAQEWQQETRLYHKRLRFLHTSLIE